MQQDAKPITLPGLLLRIISAAAASSGARLESSSPFSCSIGPVYVCTGACIVDCCDGSCMLLPAVEEEHADNFIEANGNTSSKGRSAPSTAGTPHSVTVQVNALAGA